MDCDGTNLFRLAADYTAAKGHLRPGLRQRNRGRPVHRLLFARDQLFALPAFVDALGDQSVGLGILAGRCRNNLARCRIGLDHRRRFGRAGGTDKRAIAKCPCSANHRQSGDTGDRHNDHPAARRPSVLVIFVLNGRFVVKILLIVGLARSKLTRPLLGFIVVSFAGKRLRLVRLTLVILAAVILGDERARRSRRGRRVAVARVSRRRLRCTRIAALLRRVGCSKRLVPIGARNRLRRRRTARGFATILPERIGLSNQARQLSERVAAGLS